MSQDKQNKKKHNKKHKQNYRFAYDEDQNYDIYRKEKDFKIKKRNLKEQDYDIEDDYYR